MEELNNVDLSDIDFSVEAEDWIDVSALREMYHPFNSQVRDDHELTSIQRSIQKNGFTGTLIVVNRWNGKIVSGHGKVEACFKAGYRGKLPVVWREYKGEIEHRNAMLQFNMAIGHQDPEKQRREIEALLAALPAEEVTSDLAITPDELQRILGLAVEVGSEGEETSPGSDTEPEIDKAEELRKKWNVETGQLWQLGKHRLICGDCTDRAVVDRVMKGEKATMMFTDPPYGVDYSGGIQFHKDGHVEKNNRERLSGDNNPALYEKFLPVVLPFVDGPCYMWFAGSVGKPVYDAVIENKCEIHALIIWHKTNATYAAMNAQYKQRHEPLLYFKPKNSTLRWCGPTNECTIWEIDRDGRNEYHPTQKPIALAERALKNHETAIIADFFAGSGSTLIACENLNRQCRAVEISPAYCAVILERFFVHTGVEPRIVA